MTTIRNDERGSYLESGCLRVRIEALGAEPSSLELRRADGSWSGLLVNDGLHAPEGPWWKGHAPLLFPNIGRLSGGRSGTSDGRLVEQPNHGFARRSAFALASSGADEARAWVEYELDSGDAAVGSYPWKASLFVRYELSDGRLSQRVRVRNAGSDTLHYSLGWHPGFKAPLAGGAGRKADLDIRLPAGRYERLVVAPGSGLLTGERPPFDCDGGLAFDEEALAATYVLDLGSSPKRWCELRQGGLRIRLDFDDYRYLGLWSNAGGPFVCVEPWQGLDDFERQEPFDRKEGSLALEPGTERESSVTVTVVDEPCP